MRILVVSESQTADDGQLALNVLARRIAHYVRALGFPEQVERCRNRLLTSIAAQGSGHRKEIQESCDITTPEVYGHVAGPVVR